MVLLTTETASCRLYVTCFPQGKGKPCSEMHMNEWHPGHQWTPPGDLLHWGCLVLLLCSLPTFSTLHWPRKIVTICLWLEQELPWAASAVSFAEGGYWADWPFAQWCCWTCFLISLSSLSTHILLFLLLVNQWLASLWQRWQSQGLGPGLDPHCR